MQTILGAGGAIGTELAKALKKYTTKIKLVSRNPKKVHDTDLLLATDLTKKEAVFEAVKGSSIVYITIGFPYKLSIWKENWPAFISNVTEACIQHQCKLVFFDNIYMYDKNHLAYMTEETPIRPSSNKGKIRAEVVKIIMDEVSNNKLTALIARSADFYGPSIKKTCLLTETVFRPLSIGKKANWLSSVNFKHSFTFTPDAAEATALLGNTDAAYNQIWHLPTAKNPPTGKEWIEMIAQEMDVKPDYQAAPKLLVKIMGLFMPIMKETVEMMYQYDRDYVFDSSKFETYFNYEPTPYKKGIKTIIEKDYQLKTKKK